MNFSILNFDIGLVLFYLLFTLGVGIYKGRGIKSFQDFAIGGNAFSNTALTATITATWLSAASIIGSIERIYKFGIVWLAIFLGGVLAIYIFRWFTPRIIQFKGCLSVAEILGLWYGKPARVIGGICVVMHSIGMVAAQVAAIGFVFYEFFGIAPEIGIVISAGIVVAYSSFGGIKAVTVTDVIQFAFFMTAIPVIAMIVIDPAGGYEGLYAKLPREHWRLFPSYGTAGEYITLFILFAIPFFDSCLIQRVLMARNRDQIMDCFKATAISMIIFYLLSAVTALSMRAIAPNLEAGNVLYHTINNYLPVGVKGLGIAGILAAIMSTADSYLNVSSIAVINDVIYPLRKRELSDKNKLLIAKITTFIIGMSTIVVAIRFDSVLRIVLKSWVVWAPVMVAPLYATFFGIKANSRIFLSGMAAGVATVIVWMVLDIEANTGIDSTVPSLFANLVMFGLVALYYHKRDPKKLNNPVLPNPEGDRV